MNNKFDELTKGLARSVTRALLCLAVAAPLAWPARANDFRLGPLIDLSDPDALAACGSNGRETEPSIGVNPTNQKRAETVPYVETANTSQMSGLRNCGQTPIVLGYGNM